MASHKKDQHKSWKKPSSSFGSGNYDGDSDDSTDQDWTADKNQKKAASKRCKGRSRDLAREPGEIRRNLKSKRNDRSSRKKKDGLGEDEDSVDEEPRQCYWVYCLNVARRGSKYCSDACGIKLAETRIKMLLPERLLEWQTPSRAAEYFKKELDKLNEQRANLKNEFDELEKKRQVLDAYIDKVSKISRESDTDDDTELGEDLTMDCACCGTRTSAKNYVKHVDHCFTKREKIIGFDDVDPVVLPGTKVFCHTVDKKTGRYCNRMAVNCPQHSKRPQFTANTVCGAPLSKGVITELNLNNCCTALKSKCLRHFNWEKFYRAEIDIQKVENWTAVKALKRKQASLDQQMSNRGGLLNLLLNFTKAEDAGSQTQKFSGAN